MASDRVTDRLAGEAARVTEEYARRRKAIDPSRYDPNTPGEAFIRNSRARACRMALHRAGMRSLAAHRVLEVGCGDGSWLRDFKSWGANRDALAGVELLPERAATAGRQLPGADIRMGNAATLPWEDGAFDVVAQSMMFSSILDAATRAQAAGEMTRVLQRHGVILWYDFWIDNPRNRSVRGLSAGAVARLFPGFTIDARRAVLAPPAARRLATVSPSLAQAAERLKVMNSGLVAILRREGA